VSQFGQAGKAARDFRFPQRSAAAFWAISFRFLADNPAARALPPIRPSATAAAFLPSPVITSSISPVAIMTERAFTSAGRFSPFGPLVIVLQPLLGGKHTILPSRDIPKMDPTTGTIIVALVGAIATIAAAFINNRTKDGPGQQSVDPMWRIIAAIIVIAAAIWLLIRVIVAALLDNHYMITGLVIAVAVLAIGIVLLKGPRRSQSN